MCNSSPCKSVLLCIYHYLTRIALFSLLSGDIAIDDIQFQGKCQFADDQSLKYGANALTTGCSDGGREGFFTNPTVAGCKGWWWGRKNLRDSPSSAQPKCGDDVGTWGRSCVKPADLCAQGWHVCGTFGNISEIVNRVRKLFFISKKFSFPRIFLQFLKGLCVDNDVIKVEKTHLPWQASQHVKKNTFQ